MLLTVVSGVSRAGIRQPDTDCVAENVSAFVDDHFSVKVDAVATVDVALLIVSVAVGDGAVEPAVKESNVEEPARNAGACAAEDEAVSSDGVPVAATGSVVGTAGAGAGEEKTPR